jgi:Flp pilus assembly protein TadG
MHMLSPLRATPAGELLRRQGRAWNRGCALAGYRLLSSRAGNVAVEFALAAPVLVMLMLASAELARFVILHQKMDRVATTISDLVSRAETISESELTDIFTAAGEVATPFNLADLGVVIVSSVTNPDGAGPIVAWQRSGGGAYSGTSQVGIEGDDATLTGDFEVREGETAIISEVYFDFAHRPTTGRGPARSRRSKAEQCRRPSRAVARFGTGDVLPIGDMLVGFAAAQEADFVELGDNGESATVRVDIDGAAGGSGFEEIAVLYGGRNRPSVA